VNAQQIEAISANIDSEAFRAKIEPSDEDLKAFWETRKESFLTEKRVKLSYVLAAPAYPAEESAEEEKGEEGKEEDAAAEAKKAEDRRAAEKELDRNFSTLFDRISESKGEEFEQAVKELGWELKKSDWFTAATLPPDLKLRTRSSSSRKSISSEVFDLDMEKELEHRFTYPLAVGEHQWFIGRLDDAEEVREKTFEEAKDEVKELYIEEKLQEALEAEVAAKTEAIKAALAEGTSFEDAAKALELETRKLGPWKVSEPLENEPRARDIFAQANTVAPGEFAEPLYFDDRAVIVQVLKREIVKDDNRGQQVDTALDSMTSSNERGAFAAWIDQAVREAGVLTSQS